MPADLTVDLRGLPEVEKMLGEFQGQKLQNRQRRALRAGVAVFRRGLRARARSGKYPRKFRATRTRAHRNPLGVSVSPQSPLAPIFEHGAKAHTIPISKGPFAGREVSHPGMAPRPIEVPTFNAEQHNAQRAIEDSLFEGIR